MAGTALGPAAEFLKPRLQNVIKEAEAAGYASSEVLAVLIDLLDDTDLEDSGQ